MDGVVCVSEKHSGVGVLERDIEKD